MREEGEIRGVGEEGEEVGAEPGRMREEGMGRRRLGKRRVVREWRARGKAICGGRGTYHFGDRDSEREMGMMTRGRSFEDVCISGSAEGK